MPKRESRSQGFYHDLERILSQIKNNQLINSLLKKSLISNTSFSIITGLCSLFLATKINQLFDLSTPIIFIVLGLILFSSFVFLTAFIKNLLGTIYNHSRSFMSNSKHPLPYFLNLL